MESFNKEATNRIFGDFLRRFRVSRGYTQLFVSQSPEISFKASRIRHIEAGRISASVDFLTEMARFYNLEDLYFVDVYNKIKNGGIVEI